MQKLLFEESGLFGPLSYIKVKYNDTIPKPPLSESHVRCLPNSVFNEPILKSILFFFYNNVI